MTGTELKTIIREFGLTQAQFAALSRVNERTVRRWVSDARPVPFLVEFFALSLLPSNHEHRPNNRPTSS